MHWDSISQSPRLKKYARKYLLISFSIILAFAAFIQSTNKVQAFPVAIPAGITIGAGVYTVGGMLIAAGAGQLGFEEERAAIDAHSKEVWANATQASKDSLNWSIEQAKNGGNSLVKFSNDFLNWTEAQLTAFAMKSAEMQAYGVDNPVPGFTGHGSMTKVSEQSIYRDGGYVGTSMSFQVRQLEPGWIRIEANFTSGKVDQLIQGNYDAYLNRILAINSPSSLVSFYNGVFAGHPWGQLAIGVPAALEPTYQRAYGATRELWETMRDAGLVLPVDSITSHVGDIPVRYDGQSDVYKDDAGLTYAPGDVTHAFPQPRWREKTNDIPEAGVYVDTPALTGNPAIDESLINNPAIPKTTTNITTGTTTANPDIPKPGGGTPTKPPDPTPKPLPRVPGSGAPVPIAIFLLFFDLLRALIMYLVRMFNWIMTIPFVDARPIDNPYFQWFRHAKILGVYPYTLVATMATFFLGFSLVKSVRRFLP